MANPGEAMTMSDTILLWQTIGVWVGAGLAAPLTIWAMFRQTQLAAHIAERGRRQECLEALLAAYKPGWPQSGRSYYRALNAVPALYASDRSVLERYRTFRDLGVQRDQARSRAEYSALLLRMAIACGLPLTEPDLAAALAEQWTSNT